MKFTVNLNWKKRRNGDEVAGPFRIREIGSNDYSLWPIGEDSYRFGLFIKGDLYQRCQSVGHAKRSAQTVTNQIVTNLGSAITPTVVFE